MLDGYEYVDARMALIRATDGWQVGLKVMAPAPVSSCMFQRLPGQAEWSHLTTPWPRTEWSISPSEQIPNRPGRLLVGDGPAFLNFEAAYSLYRSKTRYGVTSQSGGGKYSAA